jgi:hypothetical protein
MKSRINVFRLVLILSLVFACNMPDVNDALDTACDLSGCISLSQFSANIESALSGKVVGYISTVGSLAIVSQDGVARTPADSPSMPMDSDIRTDIASLSKVLTTIGALQSLEAHNLTIESKISPYLPPDWTQGPNIDTITFHDLLTHSAGFRVDGNGSNTTYAVLKQQIENGVNLSDKSVPQYNNLNFAIFRELLPFMEGFNDPGPAARPSTTAAFYINYMNQHVFQPLGIANAGCDPAAVSQPMLTYPVPPIGSTKGTDWGDWTLACGGGGWLLDAGELYKVMLDLAGGNTLLSDDQKYVMNTNCLGWDCSVQTQTDYVGKNGNLSSSGFVLWTFFGIFKCTVPVVVIVNSDTPSNMNITSLVNTAFVNASIPPPGPLKDPCLPAPANFQLQESPLLQNPIEEIPPDVIAIPQPTEIVVQGQPPVLKPTSTQQPPQPQPRPQPTATQALKLVPLVPLVLSTNTSIVFAVVPKAPVLVSPINKENVQCSKVTLLWRPASDPSGIKSYRIELEKLVGRSYVPEKDWNKKDETSVKFDPECNTGYRWRVRATDGAGNQGDWTNFEQFSVGDQPPR